jgi:glycosyltransferase involved in cell wall biosynthesis
MLNELDVAVLYATDKHPADRDSDGTFGHPVHRGFAEHIGAEPIVFDIPNISPISGTVIESLATAIKPDIPKYDIYLMEHTHTLFAAPLIRYLYPESHIVFLCADHRLFGLSAYRFSDNALSVIRKTDRIVDKKLLSWILNRYVDGIIANSNLNTEIARSVTDSVPIYTTLPYIEKDIYQRLVNVNPELTEKNAVMIGTNLDYKGTDLLVRGWESVRDTHPDAELHIVGPGHMNQYKEIEGINVRGFVPDIAEELERSSLYVHPARAEAFGVSVLEAMRAGVPPIVTRTTGAKSEVRQIDKSLVTDADPNLLAKQIIKYFDTALDRRRRWSAIARSRSERFYPSTRKEAFKDTFKKLITIITEK